MILKSLELRPKNEITKKLNYCKRRKNMKPSKDVHYYIWVGRINALEWVLRKRETWRY